MSIKKAIKNNRRNCGEFLPLLLVFFFSLLYTVPTLIFKIKLYEMTNYSKECKNQRSVFLLGALLRGEAIFSIIRSADYCPKGRSELFTPTERKSADAN